MPVDEWGMPIIEKFEIEEFEKPKKASMWDIMNSSINKKMKPTLEEKQRINEYMFHKLLARFEGSIPLALIFTTKDIPVEFQYDIINQFVPKAHIPFERKKSNDDETIENICLYYKCNERIAEQYLELMPPQEVERINNKFKKGKI